MKDSNKGSEKSGTQGGSRSSSRSGSARGGSRSAAQRARHSEVPALNVVQVVILVVVVALIVGGVAGFAIYRDRVKPLQTKVLIVDDLSVEMRYFLRRVRMVGREPLEVLQLLTRELIITQVAVKPPTASK